MQKLKNIVTSLVAAACYAGLAVWAIQDFSWQDSNSCPVWPAAGFAVGVVLAKGVWFVPAIWLGATLGNALTLPAPALWSAPLIGLGNASEALIVAALMQTAPPVRQSLQSLGRFLFSSALGACVAALSGVASLVLAGVVPPIDSWYATATWAAGDWAGMLTCAPFVWALLRKKEIEEDMGVYRSECILALALYAGVTLFVFTSHVFSLAFLTTPLLYFLVVRYPPLIAYAGFVLTAGIAAWGTAHGLGPFAARAVTMNDQLLMLLAYLIGGIAIPGLLLQVINHERCVLLATLRQQVAEQTAALEAAKAEAEADAVLFREMLPEVEALEQLMRESASLKSVQRMDAALQVLIARIKAQEAKEHRRDAYSG